MERINVACTYIKINFPSPPGSAADDDNNNKYYFKYCVLLVAKLASYPVV
jgi:hypothetical protein